MSMRNGNNTRGAAGSQYALILGLVSIVALLAISTVGGNVRALMTRVANTVEQAQNLGGAGTSNTGATDPTTDNVYFQCGGQTAYVAFVKNTNGLVVSNLATNVAACQAYNHKALGISNATYRSDRGFGDANNANMNLAIDCANCLWGDGGNPWYFNRSGGSCTIARGTAPAGARVAGMIANTVNTAMNCATFKQNLVSGVSLSQSSSATTHAFYSVHVNGSVNTDPNCPNRTSTTITGQFNGAPEYLLCSIAALP